MIKRGADIISNFFVNVVGALLVVTLMCLISFGAISRYGFGSAHGWITEVSAYSMLVLAFLGTAEVLKRHSHVNIDIFLNMMSSKYRALFNTCTSLLGAILTVSLCWFSIEAALDAYKENAMLVGMVEIPRFYLMTFMPIGFLLLSIYFIDHVRANWLVFTGKQKFEEDQSIKH